MNTIMEATYCIRELGLLRYIQLTVVDEKSGDPTKIMLRDRFIQCVAAAWLFTFLFLIYIA